MNMITFSHINKKDSQIRKKELMWYKLTHHTRENRAI